MTVNHWVELTRAKFKDPDIVFKNYGGQPLDFLAQINLSLSRGDRQVNSRRSRQKGEQMYSNNWFSLSLPKTVMAGLNRV